MKKKELKLSKYHDSSDLKISKRVFISLIEGILIILLGILFSVITLKLLNFNKSYSNLNNQLKIEQDECYKILEESKLYTINKDNNKSEFESSKKSFRNYAYKHIIYSYEKDSSLFDEKDVKIEKYEDLVYESASYDNDYLAYFYVGYAKKFNNYNGINNDIVDFKGLNEKEYYINLIKDISKEELFMFNNNEVLPFLKSDIALSVYKYCFLNEKDYEDGSKNYNNLYSTYKTIWEIEAKEISNSRRYQDHYEVYNNTYKTLSNYVIVVVCFSYLVSFIIINFVFRLILKDGRTLGYLICKGAVIRKDNNSLSFKDLIVRTLCDLVLYSGSLVFISFFSAGYNSGFFYPIFAIGNISISMFSISGLLLFLSIINLIFILVRKDKLSIVDLFSSTKNVDTNKLKINYNEYKNKDDNEINDEIRN